MDQCKESKMADGNHSSLLLRGSANILFTTTIGLPLFFFFFLLSYHDCNPRYLLAQQCNLCSMTAMSMPNQMEIAFLKQTLFHSPQAATNKSVKILKQSMTQQCFSKEGPSLTFRNDSVDTDGNYKSIPKHRHLFSHLAYWMC